MPCKQTRRSEQIITYLIFALLKISHDLLSQFGKVPPFDKVVRFQKDLSQPRLSDRVILQVEFVESVKRILMCVHIERVDREVISSEMK